MPDRDDDGGAAAAEAVVDLYERRARDYDRDRGRSLQEKDWLDRFLSRVPPSGTVLDIGCGTGEPIARYVVESGFRVVGIDSSPSMIAMCRDRFPVAEWHVVDMRRLALGRRFDGVLAWDSSFHLSMNDQRAMFGRFAAHVKSGTPLLFTSGPSAGESIGSCFGDPLYHASLDPGEYERLLGLNGFSVRAQCADDPECGGHTVWLATYDGDASIPDRHERMTLREAPIEIVPWDSGWASQFDEERHRLEPVLHEWLAGTIEHIGSTAVPGLAAKPVIDIMAPVRDLPAATAEYGALKAALAERYREDREAYTDAKTDFVRSILERAQKGGTAQ